MTGWYTNVGTGFTKSCKRSLTGGPPIFARSSSGPALGLTPTCVARGVATAAGLGLGYADVTSCKAVAEAPAMSAAAVRTVRCDDLSAQLPGTAVAPDSLGVLVGE